MQTSGSAVAVSAPIANDSSIDSNALRIELLGQFRLTTGASDVSLAARKDGALLAFLASSPSKPYRRALLASLLWSKSEDTRARESLKQSLLRLRKVLPQGVLDTNRHTACLMLDRHQIDVTSLEDLLVVGSFQSVMTAANRFSNDFLSDLEGITNEYAHWCSTRHHSLLQQIKSAADATLTHEICNGDTSNAVKLAIRITSLDPLDETLFRHLVSALAAEGRISQARRAFNEFREQLRIELDVNPEPATYELMDSLDDKSVQAVSRLQHAVPRIAVLPFEVGVDESSQRYFADGLTDDITTDLARNKSLEVLPASSFRGIKDDVSKLLLARGATHALQGSVRRANGRLRVNTRLLDCRDDQVVWAERYDRAMEDVFYMQDAISSQIVQRLPVELSLGTASTSGHHGTNDPYAYQMFLKGRSLYLRGINSHSLLAAKALLDRSIALDPKFARAYAQLAICESYLAMVIVNKTQEDYSAQVLEHGLQALEMNPDLALGHAAVGLAYYAAGQYQEAEDALQSAIKLDENLFETQFFLARNRRQLGDHEGAVVRFRLAAALRPDDFRSSGLLGDALKAIGLVVEAEASFRIAIQRIEAELEHHPDNAGALAFGAPILVDLNEIEKARDWSAWALTIEPKDSLSRYNQARFFSLLGEHDVAIGHLTAAFEAPLLVQRRLALWMRYDGDLKALEHHRDFRRLLKYADH